MKITYTDADDKEVSVDISIKGRHIKDAWSKLGAIYDGDEQNIDKLQEYLAWRDSVIAEASGLSVDELDDLDAEEKGKFVSYFTELVEREAGFQRR